MKLADLEKLERERISKKDELNAKYKALKFREQDAQERAQAAAELGDVKGYKAASAEAIEIGAERAVAQAQLKKILSSAAVTSEEADKMWEEYAKEYNSRFDKLYADFKKKRKAMLSAYQELISAETDACLFREKLGSFLDIPLRGHTPQDTPVVKRFPCKCLPNERSEVRLNGTFITDIDAVYYILSYIKEHNLSENFLKRGDEYTCIINVIERKTTVVH